jgi:hypothetical protein
MDTAARSYEGPAQKTVQNGEHVIDSPGHFIDDSLHESKRHACDGKMRLLNRLEESSPR